MPLAAVTSATAAAKSSEAEPGIVSDYDPAPGQPLALEHRGHTLRAQPHVAEGVLFRYDCAPAVCPEPYRHP